MKTLTQLWYSTLRNSGIWELHEWKETMDEKYHTLSRNSIL